MVAVRELFNEFYPRDTSMKIWAVFTGKGNSGQRLCTQVPYGYKGDKYGWEIDEEAAQVVREIFALCMEGLSVTNPPREDPYGWDGQVVAKILERMEYLGCTVKTRKKSYKSKKTLYLPQEERKIFPGIRREGLSFTQNTGRR